MPVIAPEEPQLALARGAALASATAPRFDASTVGLAYSQVPDATTVDPMALAGDGTALLCHDGASPDAADIASDSDNVPEGRKPFLLVGSLTSVFAAGVMALAITLAVNVQTTVDRGPGGITVRPSAVAPPPAEQNSQPAAPHPAPKSVPEPAPAAPPPAPTATVELMAPPAPAPPVLVRNPPPAPPAPAAPPPVVAPPVIPPPPIIQLPIPGLPPIVLSPPNFNPPVQRPPFYPAPKRPPWGNDGSRGGDSERSGSGHSDHDDGDGDGRNAVNRYFGGIPRSRGGSIRGPRQWIPAARAVLSRP